MKPDMTSWNPLRGQTLRFWRSLLVALAWTFISLLTVGGMPAQAANPDHVAQLLETKSCPGCDLEDADLRGVNLRDSNLEGANLKGAYLMATNLRHANLKGANLDYARMYAAILTDADLTNASTQSTLLGSAKICHTRTPGGALSNRDCDSYAG